jgi:hypothetical protein
MKLTRIEQYLAHGGEITKVPAQSTPSLPNHGGRYGKRVVTKGPKSLQRPTNQKPSTCKKGRKIIKNKEKGPRATVILEVKPQYEGRGSVCIAWSTAHVEVERTYIQAGDKYISSFFASLKKRGLEPIMYNKPAPQPSRHWRKGRKVPGHLFITKQANYERRLTCKRK